MEKQGILNDGTIVGSPVKHLIGMTVGMFIFWMILSGSTEFKFMFYGVATSAVVAWICYPLLLLENKEKTKKYFAFSIAPCALISYIFWLLQELVKANIDVVQATVRPELRINPRVIRFTFKADNPLAIAVLANSITLTPGTVTMNVTPEGLYEVHALTDGAAEGLLEGSMPKRVAKLFGEDFNYVVVKGE